MSFIAKILSIVYVKISKRFKRNGIRMYKLSDTILYVIRIGISFYLKHLPYETVMNYMRAYK